MNIKEHHIFSQKCKWCGEKIYFESLIRRNGRKQTPFNEDNSIHHCIGSRSFLSTKTKIIYKTGV
jgi:hypothetical protein